MARKSSAKGSRKRVRKLAKPGRSRTHNEYSIMDEISDLVEHPEQISASVSEPHTEESEVTVETEKNSSHKSTQLTEDAKEAVPAQDSQGDASAEDTSSAHQIQPLEAAREFKEEPETKDERETKAEQRKEETDPLLTPFLRSTQLPHVAQPLARKKITKKVNKETVLTSAVEKARAALIEEVSPGQVGEHLGWIFEEERLVTHCFACEMPGYVGWIWVVTISRLPRSREVTICEVDLLPTEDAIMAPPWVPWEQRLQPNDIGPGVVLPKEVNDPRLEPGLEDTSEDADEIAEYELGLGRERVLSQLGKQRAYARWYEGERGPRSPLARYATESCGSCGFFMRMAGSARLLFGVCANEWSPEDGKVVSVDHGCGAHSETDEQLRKSLWQESDMVLDETSVETFKLSE